MCQQLSPGLTALQGNTSCYSLIEIPSLVCDKMLLLFSRLPWFLRIWVWCVFVFITFFKYLFCPLSLPFWAFHYTCVNKFDGTSHDFKSLFIFLNSFFILLLFKLDSLNWPIVRLTDSFFLHIQFCSWALLIEFFISVFVVFNARISVWFHFIILIPALIFYLVKHNSYILL